MYRLLLFVALASFALGAAARAPELPGAHARRPAAAAPARRAARHALQAADYTVGTYSSEYSNDYAADEYGADDYSDIGAPAACAPVAPASSCLALGAAPTPQADDALALVAADMAELASGTYQVPTTAEAYARATLGAERFWWVEDNTTDTQAIVAAAGETAIVAFRGSESGLDWDTNFEINFEQYAFGVDAAGAVIIGGVHTGFLTAATAIMPALVEAIRESGATRVVLTGHSLGGALAVVVAALLEADPAAPPVSAVYTFGSPRAGDADWAAAYAALGLDERTLRFVYYRDMVPMFPPESTGFRHVGRAYFIGLRASECSASAVDEVDVCEADESLWNFVANLFTQTGCLAIGATLGGTFCTAAAWGAILTDSSPPPFAGVVCSMLDDVLLAGNPCCLISESLAEGGVDALKLWHDIAATYLPAVRQACTGGAGACAAEAYSTCGGGWTEADEEQFSVDWTARSDPGLEMTALEAASALSDARKLGRYIAAQSAPPAPPAPGAAGSGESGAARSSPGTGTVGGSGGSSFTVNGLALRIAAGAVAAAAVVGGLVAWHQRRRRRGAAAAAKPPDGPEAGAATRPVGSPPEKAGDAAEEGASLFCAALDAPPEAAVEEVEVEVGAEAEPARAPSPPSTVSADDERPEPELEPATPCWRPPHWAVDYDDLDFLRAAGARGAAPAARAATFQATHRPSGRQFAATLLARDDAGLSPAPSGEPASPESPDVPSSPASAGVLDALRDLRVLGFRGVCARPTCLLFDWVARGSLPATAAAAAAAAELTWPRRLGLARDAAAALVFLHRRAQPVVLRVLTARDVFIDEDWRARVSPVALVLRRAPDERYAAPEVLAGAGAAPASDVYSLGMVLWHLAALAPPWRIAARPEGAAGAVLAARVVAGARPPFPPGTPPALAALMRRCCDASPTRRPTAPEALEELERLLGAAAQGLLL